MASSLLNTSFSFIRQGYASCKQTLQGRVLECVFLHMNFKQGNGNLVSMESHFTSDMVCCFLVFPDLVSHEDTRSWGPGGRHCVSQMAPLWSALNSCYCSTPQIFLCDLSFTLLIHTGITDAYIPTVALGKCINKYIRKREKDIFSPGDLYPRKNKRKISVTQVAYSAPVQGRYNISGLHICLKWWQLSLPKWGLLLSIGGHIKFYYYVNTGLTAVMKSWKLIKKRTYQNWFSVKSVEKRKCMSVKTLG